MADATTPTPTPVIDPRELNDLTDFAARGGLGQAVATHDCVAQSPDQLMYITGDTLVLLRDVRPAAAAGADTGGESDIALASCEGVVGWINKAGLEFKLNKEQSASVPIPDTIVSSPTPPSKTVELPHVTEDAYAMESDSALDEGERLDASAATAGSTPETKRSSGPFDLGTPQYSPDIPHVQQGFFEEQQQQQQQGQGQTDEVPGVRNSVLSTASSEALGGIGGFMMGMGMSEPADASIVEELAPEEEDGEPSEAPQPQHSTPIRSTATTTTHNANSLSPTASDRPGSGESWDIYGDYARDSMYYKRSTRDIKAMSGMDQAFNLAKALRDIPSPPPVPPPSAPAPVPVALPTAPGPPVGQDTMSPASLTRPRPLPLDLSSETGSPSPVAEEEMETLRSPGGTITGRSIATELRLRIQKEREQGATSSGSAATTMLPSVPPRSSSRLTAAIARSDAPAPGSPTVVPPPALFVTNAEDDDEQGDAKDEPREGPAEGDALALEVGDDSMVESEQSTIIETPIGPTDEVDNPVKVAATVSDEVRGHESKTPEAGNGLASPIPLDETGAIPKTATVTAKSPSPVLDQQQQQQHPTPQLSVSPIATPSKPHSPISRDAVSPSLSVSVPGSPFSPGTPASPHSITATRQAATEIARSVSASASASASPRVTTLLGRTDEWAGAKGPVPITFHMGSPGGFRSTGPVSPLGGTHGLGLGMPTGPSITASSSSHSKGRISPSGPPRRATSPLVGSVSSPNPNANPSSPLIDRPLLATDSGSRFPAAPRHVTSPALPSQTYTPVPSTSTASATATDAAASAKAATVADAGVGSKPKLRARSRSFGATVAKAIGRGKKDKEKDKVPALPTAANSSKNAAALSPKSANVPPLPPPSSTSQQDKKPASPTVPAPVSLGPPLTKSRTTGSESSRAVSITSADKVPTPKTPSSSSLRKASKTLPSPLPVSHRDFQSASAEETVKADGLDFELVSPTGKASPALSINTDLASPQMPAHRPGMSRSETSHSNTSARSIPLPETDEWGFIKDQSPTPEMFQSRSTASDHRLAEQKWLGIVSTPLPPATAPPKKVRKLAFESGIPASLRGKVWAWMLSPARVPGKFPSKSAPDAALDEHTGSAIQSVYADHSVFAGPYATGTSDLRSILLALPASLATPDIALIAGMLLIHCVAEDAFWLLDGLIISPTAPLAGYFTPTTTTTGSGNKVEVDAAVFAGVLAGSEKPMSRKFKDMGLHPRTFLEKWYRQLFIRCLPWPTALRVIDAVIAEGPRFMLVASLSILSLSRERIMACANKSEVLDYLSDLPQDALLLPEHFMKACAEVRFREEDYRRLRAGVEQELGL